MDRSIRPIDGQMASFGAPLARLQAEHLDCWLVEPIDRLCGQAGAPMVELPNAAGRLGRTL